MKKLHFLIFFLLCAWTAQAQMMTDAQLALAADTIQNETVRGKNTAERIGRMFNNIIDNKVNKANSVTYGVALSDLTSSLTTGTNKAYFRVPKGMTVTAVRASLLTAQTSGSVLTIDINEAGTSILSTKLTIDNSEKTSVTAVTAAVISDIALADDAEITFDIDVVGAGGAGLIVWIIGY